ncbi:MAG: ABC transporter permease subunit [Candidatus Saliniplasma sp.]
MDSKHKKILAIAKKEFMNNVRNKWVFILGLVFVGLILLTSAYGGLESRGEAGIKGYEFTISVGSEMVVLLTSVVAIMLGYKTVVEEVESGNIGLLLTSELDRKEIVTAKFLGLSTVLTAAVVGGLAVGGVLIGIMASFEGALDYLYFMVLSLLFSLVFLSLAVLMSSVVKKKSHALAGGIFLWLFFNIVFELILFGVLVAREGVPDLTGSQVEFVFPDWYWFASLLSPNETFSMGVRLIMERIDLPAILNLPFIVGSLLLWIIVPLALSLYIFERNDL